jgi:hypothetical protein
MMVSEHLVVPVVCTLLVEDRSLVMAQSVSCLIFPRSPVEVAFQVVVFELLV